MPAPPYSSGNWIPISPSAASFGSKSTGNACRSSHSITCGRISASANSRTVRRSSSWSSLKRKSIGRNVARGQGASGCCEVLQGAGCCMVRRTWQHLRTSTHLEAPCSTLTHPGLSCPMRKALVFVVFLLLPTPAFADLTLFLGINGTPSKRQVRGFSGGIGLVIVAFEFEYASTSEDLEELAPSLKTYMFNGLLQTPFAIGGFQPYGTVGGGVYRERLGEGTAAVQ